MSTPWLSKKHLGFLIIAALLMLGALIVSPANFGALSIALTGLYAAFAGGNVAATALAGRVWVAAPPVAPAAPVVADDGQEGS